MRTLPHPLRLPSAIFASALILGAAMLWLALDGYTASRSRYTTTEAAARHSASDLAMTPQRLEKYKMQEDSYIRLRRAGFLGEENRLDWLGSLAQLRASLSLERLNWRLAPREPSSLTPGLYSSTMTIEITPGDSHHLTPLLERLRLQAHGRFTVRECTLLPETNGRSASCTLDWWSWNGQ